MTTNSQHPDHAALIAKRFACLEAAKTLAKSITMDDTPEQHVIGVQHAAMLAEYDRLHGIITQALEEDAIAAGAVGDY
jgi:hypothetical protein